MASAQSASDSSDALSARALTAYNGSNIQSAGHNAATWSASAWSARSRRGALSASVSTGTRRASEPTAPGAPRPVAGNGFGARTTRI